MYANKLPIFKVDEKNNDNDDYFEIYGKETQNVWHLEFMEKFVLMI